MARYLITGASGFIGSRLTAHLLSRRARVVAVTRDRSRIDAQEGVEIVEGLFSDPALLESVGDVDAVVHLAVSGSDDSGEMTRVNVDGAAALAAWAAAAGVGCFFHASSIEAQGPGSDASRKLTDADPCQPVSAYGRSKLAGETAVREALEGSATRAVLARIGNVYGPGSPGFVFPMAEGVLSNPGLGQAFRELRDARVQPIFVEDLVRIVHLCLETSVEGIHYFVGTEDTSVREWFDAVAALLHAKPARTGNADWDHELVQYYRSGGERLARLYAGDALYDVLGTVPRYDLLRGTAAVLATLA